MWPLLSFPNLLAYWLKHLATSSFKDFKQLNWNSITSTSFVCSDVAHLTSHSRMSGSSWVITPSWLSGSWRSLLYSSSVYSCHLFLISSASVRSTPEAISVLHCVHLCMISSLVSLIFLKRSLVFPILLVSSLSLHWSLRKAFLSLLAILWNSAFKWIYISFSPLPLASVLFSAICKASSDSQSAFLHVFYLGMVLIPISCTMSWTSAHRSSGTLTIRSNPLNLFVTSTV